MKHRIESKNGRDENGRTRIEQFSVHAILMFSLEFNLNINKKKSFLSPPNKVQIHVLSNKPRKRFVASI
jgi:hypothetical protein